MATRDRVTMVVIRCADSNRTLDTALVFIKDDGDRANHIEAVNEAVQVGADAGIPDAYAAAEVEMPNGFYLDEAELYELQAYTG